MTKVPAVGTPVTAGTTTIDTLVLLSTYRRMTVDESWAPAHDVPSSHTATFLKGAIMPGLNREQLEALRRQVEEDYKLDLAAIERLQRRFIPPGAPPSSVNS